MAEIIAFDVVGTLFSLESLRRPLADAGAPETTLELWFAESLRDFFAISHAGGYVPLRTMLEEGLARRFASLGIGGRKVDGVMAAIAQLEPSAGADEAVKVLTDAGCSVFALTNGSERMTARLMEQAGMREYFTGIVSCDSFEVSKPHPMVYDALRRYGAGETWLVAAHAWDVMGAARAGLKTVWVSSKEGRYPEAFPMPDVVATDLAAAAYAILDERG